MNLRTWCYRHLAYERARKLRARRMVAFLDLINIRQGMRVVDLGSTADLWQLLGGDVHVTLVNLGPDTGAKTPSGSSRFTYVYADACELGEIFTDGAFDLVFSNATIEHVGNEARQEAFAHEVRRLAPAYWVQTTSDRFAIESHCLIPFCWSFPQSMRDRLITHWARTMPVWSEFMRNTRVLSRRRMSQLFPGSECYVERYLGLEKSYAFYLPCGTRTLEPGLGQARGPGAARFVSFKK